LLNSFTPLKIGTNIINNYRPGAYTIQEIKYPIIMCRGAIKCTPQPRMSGCGAKTLYYSGDKYLNADKYENNTAQAGGLSRKTGAEALAYGKSAHTDDEGDRGNDKAADKGLPFAVAYDNGALSIWVNGQTIGVDIVPMVDGKRFFASGTTVAAGLECWEAAGKFYHLEAYDTHNNDTTIGNYTN